jgi:hypothetical protein
MKKLRIAIYSLSTLSILVLLFELVCIYEERNVFAYQHQRETLASYNIFMLSLMGHYYDIVHIIGLVIIVLLIITLMAYMMASGRKRVQ